MSDSNLVAPQEVEASTDVPVVVRPPLRVFTAQLSYRGEDRLDITRKSGGTSGSPFAPSWQILGPALTARAAHRLPEHWPTYREAYLQEMRGSYRSDSSPWHALLARVSVTLCCYCADARHCHRRLLAEILVRLGAVDEGERTSHEG